MMSVAKARRMKIDAAWGPLQNHAPLTIRGKRKWRFAYLRNQPNMGERRSVLWSMHGHAVSLYETINGPQDRHYALACLEWPNDLKPVGRCVRHTTFEDAVQCAQATAGLTNGTWACQMDEFVARDIVVRSIIADSVKGQRRKFATVFASPRNQLALLKLLRQETKAPEKALFEIALDVLGREED